MGRTYGQQKAALTRAERSSNPAEKVKAECERVVQEWNENGWPDNWHRWNIALGDATGLHIDDLSVAQ